MPRVGEECISSSSHHVRVGCDPLLPLWGSCCWEDMRVGCWNDVRGVGLCEECRPRPPWEDECWIRIGPTPGGLRGPPDGGKCVIEEGGALLQLGEEDGKQGLRCHEECPSGWSGLFPEGQGEERLF